MNVFCFFFEILFVRGVTTFSSDCTGRNSLLETHRHVLLLFLMNSPEKEVLFNHRTTITHSRIIQCPLTNATKPMKQFYLNQCHVRSCYGTSRVSSWKLSKKMVSAERTQVIVNRIFVFYLLLSLRSGKTMRGISPYCATGHQAISSKASL